MKIILFGLLVAVLVVYGYAEDTKDKHDELLKRDWEKIRKYLDDIKHYQDVIRSQKEYIALRDQRMKEYQIEVEKNMRRIDEAIEKLKNRG